MTATRDDIPIEQGERFATTPEEAAALGRLWDRQLPGQRDYLYTDAMLAERRGEPNV